MGSSAVSLLSLLLVLGTSTVLADVIPISITRQVTANGSVDFICPPFGCGSESFSASDTSQALGPYNVTKAGSAAQFPPPSPVDISGSAHQNSNITSDQITIDMNTSANLNGVVVPAIVSSDAFSDFSFQFTVDVLSQVHIFGATSLDLFSQMTTILVGPDFAGTQSIALTGPGVDFDPSIPVLNGIFSASCSPPSQVGACEFTQTVPIDSMFTLAPGQYMLDVNTDAGVSYQSSGGGPLTGLSDLSLTVDFMEVPEPSLVSFLLLSAAAAIWRRRTSASKHRPVTR